MSDSEVVAAAELNEVSIFFWPDFLVRNNTNTRLHNFSERKVCCLTRTRVLFACRHELAVAPHSHSLQVKAQAQRDGQVEAIIVMEQVGIGKMFP